MSRKSVLAGKTFLMSAGAVKAGSSWLFDMLARQEDASFIEPKELRVFDARFSALSAGLPKFRILSLARILEEHGNDPVKAMQDEAFRDHVKHLNMYIDDDAYFAHFENNCDLTKKLIGDISPDYGLIPLHGLQSIHAMFEQRGINLKVILIIRDPIERHFSALRSMESEKKKLGVLTNTAGWRKIFRPQKPWSALEKFESTLTEPKHLERAAYHKIIPNLHSAFGKERVHIQLFETLFTETAMERLSSFLGIPLSGYDFNKVVHKTPVTTPLTDDLIRKGQQAYAPVFEYCQKLIGNDIREYWKYST